MSRENVAAARETMPNLDGYNYHLVTSQDPEILSARVQALIDHGWKVNGGVATASEGENVAYVQAMMKA